MINSNFYSINSQDLPDIFIDSGQFYWEPKSMEKNKKIFCNNYSFLELKKNNFKNIKEKKDLNYLKKISRKLFKKRTSR